MATAGSKPPPESAPDPVEILERELARAYRIERALRDVGLAIGTTLDLDALLRLILERTIDALEAERATLYLLEERINIQDGPEWVLVSRVFEGGNAEEITLHLGQGIAGEVARTGRVANVRDAYADPRFSRSWDERSGYRTRSVLCVPLRSQLGRVTGVIQVLNKLPEPAYDGASSGGFFDDDDEALLAALAAQAAVSIEQARLFVSLLDKNRELSGARAALEKRVGDLNVLFAIERATARAGSRDELAVALLPEVAKALRARTAYIVLADDVGDLELLHLGGDSADFVEDGTPERGPFGRVSVHPDDAPRSSIPPLRSSLHNLADVAQYSTSRPVNLMERLALKTDECITGVAMKTNAPVICADFLADPRVSVRVRDAIFVDSATTHQAPALVVPLTGESEVPFGALAVVRRTHEPAFDRDDTDLMRLLALNASTGFQLESARGARVKQDRLSTIGSLLSGVMHDLKTPMTVISGYAQLMEQTDDRQDRAKYAHLLLKQFDHISAMQREVLEFARGTKTMLVRRVYLTKFFGDIQEQVQLELERRKLPVDLVMQIVDRGTARFDESKVTRAVHNLTRNAMDAMGAIEGSEVHDKIRGTLTLRVARDPANSDLLVSVLDTGPGLPPEVEARLFQQFVTSGKPTGTGLGLAIVKKIAEDHGGSVDVYSSTHGACFTLRLPQVSSQSGISGTTGAIRP